MKTYGLESVLRSLDWRTPRWLFHYSHVLLTRGPLEIGDRPLDSGHTFGLAAETDVYLFEEIGIPEKTILQRIAAGDVCGIALSAERKLSAMLWTATGNIFIDEAGHELDLGSDSVYSYNALTAKSERRKGLFRGCAKAVYDFHIRHGRQFVYGAVSIYNSPSQAAGTSIRRETVGETILVRFCGLEFLRTKKWPSKMPGLRMGFRKRSGDLRRV